MSGRGSWRDPEDISDSDASDVDQDAATATEKPRLKPLAPRTQPTPPIIDLDSDSDDSDVEVVSERPAPPTTTAGKNARKKAARQSMAQRIVKQDEMEACANDVLALSETLGRFNIEEQYTVDDLVFDMADLELCRQFEDVYATSEPTDFYKTHSDRRYYSTSTEGDMIYQQLIACLEVMPLKLSYLQKMFITLALNVLAPIIYGDEWRNRTAEVMKRRGWADLNPLMAAICARRFGKTIAVSILSAMLLLCVPGVQIAVFAPSHKQAVALLKSAVDILKSHPWWGNYRVHSDTQQKVEIIGPDGTVRSIAAYASKHKVSVQSSGGRVGMDHLRFCARAGHLI